MPKSDAAYWRILQGDELPASTRINGNRTPVSVWFSVGRLHVNGLEIGYPATLSVYSTSGICLHRSVVETSNPFVDLDLPDGIYVVGVELENNNKPSFQKIVVGK
jgi:hypothetical protein